ncbi:MAG: hypothetical protein JST47_06300 [Bacteroidetes bacterium]|nr:hypothetical protein [Bacteroidota bacterium]MBS1974483.1 hypothetical protein [Bacteroidota bacterium]
MLTTRLIFTFFLACAFLAAKPQETINNDFTCGGAVIMAVKTADGIVMVADSRLAYRSLQTQELLAYDDGIPKIFPLKKFALGISGEFSDGSSLIRKIVTDFDKSEPSYRTPEECLYKFGLFTRDNYPVYYKSLDTSTLICAGYGPEPMIAILLNGKTYPINQDLWASNVFKEIDSLHLFAINPETGSRKAAEIAANTMEQYIKAMHKENEAGSLFSVLKISSDNSWKWLKNDFTGNDYLTECEAATAIYNKQARLEFTSGDNKKLMMGYVKAIRKYCQQKNLK